MPMPQFPSPPVNDSVDREPELRILYAYKAELLNEMYATTSLYLLRQEYLASKVAFSQASTYSEAVKTLNETRVDIVISGAVFPGEPEHETDNPFKRGGVQLLKHVAKLNEFRDKENPIAFCFLSSDPDFVSVKSGSVNFEDYLAKHGLKLPREFPFFLKAMTTIPKIIDDFKKNQLPFPRPHTIGLNKDAERVQSPIRSSEELFSFLRGLDIDFEMKSCPQTENEVAFFEKISGACCKNLLVRRKIGENVVYWLIILPTEKTADLKKITKELGLKKPRLCLVDKGELPRVLGVETGFVTPFALANVNDQIGVVLDKEMLTREKLCFRPADTEKTVLLSPKDLLTFLEARGYSPVIMECGMEERANGLVPLYESKRGVPVPHAKTQTLDM